MQTVRLKLHCRLSPCSLPVIGALEPRHQVELPHPPAARTIERANVIDLADGKPEQIDPRRGADAADRFAIAAAESRPRVAAPRDARVAEDREFDRQRTVEVAAAEGAP